MGAASDQSTGRSLVIGRWSLAKPLLGPRGHGCPQPCSRAKLDGGAGAVDLLSFAPPDG